MTHKVGVVGASGYTGAELMRLALGHADLDLQVATSREFAGQRVASVYPNLTTRLEFTELDLGKLAGLDLVFLALPHGASAAIALEIGARGPKLVDLSADFRLTDSPSQMEWSKESQGSPGWVYGLTELHREDVAKASFIANPGCYPTASLLGVAPLVDAGVISPEGISLFGASGVSGAGRGAKAGTHFSHVDSNFKLYGAPGHGHTPEIEQVLSAISGTSVVVNFLPHLVPMPRGLQVTAVAKLITNSDPLEALQATYASEPFVTVMATWPETKFVCGSNMAHVSAKTDPRSGDVLVSCVIDNLGKGAAGQAIQNANLMLGLPESAGLLGAGIYP